MVERPDADALSALTPRERECLRLVYQHMTSKEIALRLGISKHTVDERVEKARRRLGAKDRYAAARALAAWEAAGAPPTEWGRHPVGLGEESGARPVSPSVAGGVGRASSVGSSGGVRSARQGSGADAGGRDAGVQLGGPGAAAGGPEFGSGAAGPGVGPGGGGAAASGGDASGAAVARDPVPGLDAAGGEPAGAAPLSLTARLGQVVLMALAAALAFGAVVGGLKLLADLA